MGNGIQVDYEITDKRLLEGHPKNSEEFYLMDVGVWVKLFVGGENASFAPCSVLDLTEFFDQFLDLLKNKKNVAIGYETTGQGYKSYFKIRGKHNILFWYKIPFQDYQGFGKHGGYVNGEYKDLTPEEWLAEKNILEKEFIVDKKDLVIEFNNFLGKLIKELFEIQPGIKDIKEYNKLINQKSELEKFVKGEYK